jgi:membrane protein
VAVLWAWVSPARSRGAAIAYCTVFSLAPVPVPVPVIVIAIAGLFFGEEAARDAILGEIGGMTGKDGAAAIQSMIRGASSHPSGCLASGIGIVTLIVTASGVFTEMQTALKAELRPTRIRG